MSRPIRPSRASRRTDATPGGYQRDARVREALGAASNDAAAPKMSGRALPGAASGAAPLAPRAPVAVGGMLSAGAGGSPFKSSQVDVGTNIAPSSANSFQVTTIVVGAMVMFLALVMAAMIVIVVGYLGWVGRTLDGGEAVKPKTHQRDTGLVNEIDPNALIRQGGGKRRVKAASEVEADALAEMFGGIGGAPVTVYTKGKMSSEYHGIEVFCDRVPGFRERAPLRLQKGGRRRAHIAIIPATKCRLVFQGNVPVKTYVTGGDVVTCTFNPIVCR